MRWPDAVVIAAGWLSAALMVFSMSQCTARQSEAHAKIMSSPGNHVE